MKVSAVDDLTARERDVARAAAGGASTRVISDQLFISSRTVESHLASIYRKLDVNSRPELVALLAAAESHRVASPSSGLRLAKVMSPPSSFVGRVDELAMIAEALNDVRAGDRRIVMVGGESGIGKSSLIAKALTVPGAADATILASLAVEGFATPFGSISDAIQPYLDASPGSLGALTGPAGGALGMVLPGLSSRLEPLKGSVDATTRPRLVIDAFTHVLRSISTQHLVVLVLEDLHWVDPATISFLRRLITSDEPFPLLLLASFRDTELDHSHVLPGFLADLWGAQDVTRIHLDGLELQDAQVLARELSDVSLPDDVITRFHEASGGNALYLSQLLSQATSVSDFVANGRIPASLQDIVVARLGRFGATQVGPLDVAALIGMEFELSILERAVSMAELQQSVVPVIGVLEQAEQAGLVTWSDTAGESLRFVHDVVRATLVERMSPARLARLHPAVGHAMAEHWSNDRWRAPLIAGHLARSNDPQDRIEAGEYALAAVTGDLTSISPDAAAELVTMALGVLPGGLEADRIHLGLLRELAIAHFLRLDLDSHRLAILQAVAVARRLGTPEDLALAVEPFRILPRTGNVDAEILGLVDEAIAGLAGRDRGALRARLIGFASYQRAIGGFGFGVATQAESAVREAQESGDRSALALTVYALSAVMMGSPDIPRQLAVGADLMALREELPDDIDPADGHRVLGTVHLQAGDREAFEVDRASLSLGAERTQSVFLGAMSTMWLALSELLDGNLEGAATANNDLLVQALSDPNLLLGWFAQACVIRAEQGRAAEMASLADQTLADHPDLTTARVLASWVHSAAGDSAKSWDVLQPLAVAGIERLTGDWLLPGTLGLLVPVLAEAGTDDHCRAALDRLREYSGQMLGLGSGTAVLGAADRFSGLLLFRLGETQEAMAALAAADDLERAFRAPLCAAHTAVATARVLFASGLREEGRRADEILSAVAREAEARDWKWVAQCELMARRVTEII